MKKKHKDEEKNDAKKTGEGAMDDDQRDDLEDNSDKQNLIMAIKLMESAHEQRCHRASISKGDQAAATNTRLGAAGMSTQSGARALSSSRGAGGGGGSSSSSRGSGGSGSRQGGGSRAQRPGKSSRGAGGRVASANGGKIRGKSGVIYDNWEEAVFFNDHPSDESGDDEEARASKQQARKVKADDAQAQALSNGDVPKQKKTAKAGSARVRTFRTDPADGDGATELMSLMCKRLQRQDDSGAGGSGSGSGGQNAGLGASVLSLETSSAKIVDLLGKISSRMEHSPQATSPWGPGGYPVNWAPGGGWQA
ncbi:unnamed protein product [Ectocarpus sp. 6 AP-2014]